MKKENIGYLVAGVLLIVLAFFLFRNCDGSKNEKVKVASGDSAADIKTADSLQVLVNECFEISIHPANLKEHIANLQRALNKCKGIITLEEKIDFIFKNQRITKSEPPRQYRSSTRTTPRRPSGPSEDVPEKSFGSGSFSGSTSTGSVKRTVDQASDINSGVKVAYTGNIPQGSKVGITVTADRFRLYYIQDKYLRENGMTIPAPRLNGTDGPEFTLDSQTGYWYYLDANTLLSPSMVNNWSYYTIWCVYIGRIGTWDGFLPHESLKALMKKVRGREDGAISMEELYRMHETNSEVWTDQNKTGLYMPKNFNPLSGERERGIKKGPEDGLEYQGWDFFCRTTGEVVTEKVNGSSSSYQSK